MGVRSAHRKWLWLAMASLFGCSSVLESAEETEAAGSASRAEDESEQEERGSTCARDQFYLTAYTLALEGDFKSQPELTVRPSTSPGGSFAISRSFLCSKRGVAMQGSGRTAEGMLAQYVGAGRFLSGSSEVTDCGSSAFKLTNVTDPLTKSLRKAVPFQTIAVDPKIIKLGRWVWIQGAGRWFHSDDTGGGIHGNHLDIYVGAVRLTELHDHEKIKPWMNTCSPVLVLREDATPTNATGWVSRSDFANADPTREIPPLYTWD